MKLVLAAVVAALALPFALPVVQGPAAQETKWKPFEFKGDESYEFKLTIDDGSGTPKTSGFLLDVRNKSEEDFEVTWSIRSVVKKSEMNEQSVLAAWASTVPAAAIMTPMYAMFVNELELKEGEKMSVFGAGTVKVIGKETIGGRTGFKCQFSTKSDGEAEVLTWEWTVDPELALPIKSIVYDGGSETSRTELVKYEKR